jgi:hypothetical protein
VITPLVGKAWLVLFVIYGAGVRTERTVWLARRWSHDLGYWYTLGG